LEEPDGRMNKKDPSERDICSKFMGPAIKRAGWDGMLQIREEVAFRRAGSLSVANRCLGVSPSGKITSFTTSPTFRSPSSRRRITTIVLATVCSKLSITQPRSISPFVFSPNGDAFVFHDCTGQSAQKEANLTLEQFPSPAELWEKYRAWKGLSADEEKTVLQDYFDDASGKAPRFCQCNAVNAAIEAIAKGQNRSFSL
jgi:type I restriction enzyme, R subunit